MDSLTLFGLLAVSAMLVFYALEDRSPWYILAFAGACALASLYGFLQGAWPFGVVEAIWSAVAVHRWRVRAQRWSSGSMSLPRGKLAWPVQAWQRCRLAHTDGREQHMIGRLNHVAIAVPDIEAASDKYRGALGADVGVPFAQPEHGVTVVFITLPNTKIELLEPLGEGSPIAAFLERNPAGGIHHICYEVDDILAARDKLKASGARVLGDGNPRIGAHGKPVLFLHPKDFNGTLVELEQA